MKDSVDRNCLLYNPIICLLRKNGDETLWKPLEVLFATKGAKQTFSWKSKHIQSHCPSVLKLVKWIHPSHYCLYALLFSGYIYITLYHTQYDHHMFFMLKKATLWPTQLPHQGNLQTEEEITGICLLCWWNIVKLFASKCKVKKHHLTDDIRRGKMLRTEFKHILPDFINRHLAYKGLCPKQQTCIVFEWSRAFVLQKLHHWPNNIT